MSELQNEDSPIEPNEPVVENLDNGSELAPDSDDQHESNDQVDEEAKKRQATQDVINTKTFEAKQAQRDLQSANDKLKAFEDKEQNRLAAAVATIPPVPDQYDDDFDQKMADRDAALLAQADYNSSKAATLRNQQFQQQQADQQREQEIHKSVIAYDAKATELGITPNELKAAGTAVMQYGFSDDLSLHILGCPDGPLITKHLAEYPQEGFELASMSPYAVGPYLEGIRAKAAGLKPKQSNTPNPVDSLQGNGAREKKHPALEGVIYT